LAVWVWALLLSDNVELADIAWFSFRNYGLSMSVDDTDYEVVDIIDTGYLV